jgi:hypothetical protein
LDEFGKPIPHDERPVEVEANEYALELYHLAVEVMKD